MPKTVIDTEVLEATQLVMRMLAIEAMSNGDLNAAGEANHIADTINKAINDSIGLRIFTKEEVDALEKHFDLGAFFEE